MTQFQLSTAKREGMDAMRGRGPACNVRDRPLMPPDPSSVSPARRVGAGGLDS